MVHTGSDMTILRENSVFAINHSKPPLSGTGRRIILNLPVDHLDTYQDRLRAKELEIEPDILEWRRGRHSWIRDPDGNRIEFYEEVMLKNDNH